LARPPVEVDFRPIVSSCFVLLSLVICYRFPVWVIGLEAKVNCGTARWKADMEGPMWTDSLRRRRHKSATTVHSLCYICPPQVLSIRWQRPGEGRRARPISGQNWPSPALASA